MMRAGQRKDIKAARRALAEALASTDPGRHPGIYVAGVTASIANAEALADVNATLCRLEELLVRRGALR